MQTTDDRTKQTKELQPQSSPYNSIKHMNSDVIASHVYLTVLHGGGPWSCPSFCVRMIKKIKLFGLTVFFKLHTQMNQYMFRAKRTEIHVLMHAHLKTGTLLPAGQFRLHLQLWSLSDAAVMTKRLWWTLVLLGDKCCYRETHRMNQSLDLRIRVVSKTESCTLIYRVMESHPCSSASLSLKRGVSDRRSRASAALCSKPLLFWKDAVVTETCRSITPPVSHPSAQKRHEEGFMGSLC